MLIFIYMLQEGQMGDTREPSKKQLFRKSGSTGQESTFTGCI
jgi:hypothetical protein